MADPVTRSVMCCQLKETPVKNIVKSILSLAVVAVSGLVLMTPVSAVSSTNAPGVLVQEAPLDGNPALSAAETARRGIEEIAIRVDPGTSDFCHQLSRECTLRHGYGNGIFWRCMKEGGCGG